jgi:tetratricopeptide (TPR) repeat protein
MAIEGPLRELGIHDVFQLLDLSRKTGVLRVVSELRDDEGVVFFNNGRVVQASARRSSIPIEVALLQSGRITESDITRARALQSNGRAGAELPDLLVEIGAVSAKELQRQLRSQIQSVVFDLMSWREGFFSFEERPRAEVPSDMRIAVSTESLLMEGARRIDEWSRIADTIPNVGVIPELASIEDDRDGPTLDLLPHEWQVLTMIDGVRDLREIAAALGRDEFEIAKVAYGLTRTGVIAVRIPQPSTPSADDAGIDTRLATARALMRAGQHVEAADELRRAAQEDPLTPRVHLELAFAVARVGDLAAACASWEHFLRLAPADREAGRVRAAIGAARHLQNLIEAHADD